MKPDDIFVKSAIAAYEEHYGLAPVRDVVSDALTLDDALIAGLLRRAFGPTDGRTLQSLQFGKLWKAMEISVGNPVLSGALSVAAGAIVFSHRDEGDRSSITRPEVAAIAAVCLAFHFEYLTFLEGRRRRTWT